MTEHQYVVQRIKALGKIQQALPKDAADLKAKINEQTEIFCDIIPSYKIEKKKSKKDKAERESKEELEIQRIEHAILAKYKNFVIAQIKLAANKSPEVAAVGCHSLCTLLTRAAHFNFAGAVIEAVVEGASHKFSPMISAECVLAIQDLLDSDGTGQASLKVVSAINQQLKAIHHHLNPRLLSALMFVRITSLDKHRPETAEHSSKKKKKNKEEQAVDKALKEGEALMSPDEQKTLKTNLLQRLLAVFLRGIQIARDAPTQTLQARLIRPTMDGLAKYAHLLGIEPLTMLLKAVQELLENTNSTAATSLHAVNTGVALTTALHELGLGTLDLAQSSDLGIYYDHLYRLIPAVLQPPTLNELSNTSRLTQAEAQMDEDIEVMTSARSEADGNANFDLTSVTSTVIPFAFVNPQLERTERVKLLLSVMDTLLIKQKHIPTNRATAFAKRVALHLVHQPPHLAATLLSFLRVLGERIPDVADLVVSTMKEGVVGGVGMGAGKGYNPDTDRPDNANARATHIWEPCLLSKSYHPGLRVLGPFVQEACYKAQTGGNKAGLVGQLKIEESVRDLLPRDVISGHPTKMLKALDATYGQFRPPLVKPLQREVMGKRKLRQLSVVKDVMQVQGGDEPQQQQEEDTDQSDNDDKNDVKVVPLKHGNQKRGQGKPPRKKARKY